MTTSSTSKSKQALAPQQSLHFYKNDHLATEVAANGNRHVLWANDVALVQLNQDQTAEMLQVDLANSVLGLGSESKAYSPYGYLNTDKSQALLGFNGQWCDPLTQGYPLGAGRRIYSPSQMRFYSNDPLSPFEKGGLHPSAYCEGDPINRYDPTGQFFQLIRTSANRIVQRAVTNFGRSVNFATSGISRNPTPIDPQMQKTYSAVRTIAQMSTGSPNPAQAIPLPAQSLPHSSRPATPSNVTNTTTTSQIFNPAPRPVTQENRMPAAPGEFRRTGFQMAVQQVIVGAMALAFVGGIIAVFVVAIRHSSSHKE